MRNKTIRSAKAHPPTGGPRPSGKPLLSSSAYQIFAVVMISTSLIQQSAAIPGVCVAGPIGPSGGSGSQPCYTGWCIGCKSSTGPSAAEVAQQEAYNLNQQGIQYYNNKQWKLAVNAFRNALKDSPGDNVIRNNLSNALLGLGVEAEQNYPVDYRFAVRCYEEALRYVQNVDARKVIEERLRAAKEALADKNRVSEAKPNMDRMLSQFGAEMGGQHASGSADGVAGDKSGLDTTFLDPNKPIATSDAKPRGTKFFGQGGDQGAKLGQGELSGTDTRVPQNPAKTAIEQAEAAASPGQRGTKAPFDTAAEKVPSNLNPAVDLRNVGKAPLYPADMGDSRMANAQQELIKLQSQGDELRTKLEKLTEERNQTKDPAKMTELTAQVDQAQKEYGGNQFDISNKKDEMDKIHRSIESDREQAASPSGAGNQDNKQEKNGVDNEKH